MKQDRPKINDRFWFTIQRAQMRRAFGGRPLQTDIIPSWNSLDSARAAERQILRYLISHQWEALQPWESLNVNVRATRRGRLLNVALANQTTLSFPSLLRDISQISTMTGQPIVLLHNGTLHARVLEQNDMRGILVLTREELAGVEKRLPR